MISTIIYHFLLPIWVTFYNPTPAAKYEVARVPEALKENAHAVVREHETTFTVKSVSAATKKIRYVVTILDENAAEHAILMVPYDKQSKVNYLKGTLYDQNGKETKQLKKSDIIDVSAVDNGSLFDDSRVKGAKLNALQYPYTVEYEYEISYNGLLFYPTWLPQDETNLAVESAKFQVIIPAGMTFRHKGINLPDKPQVSVQDKNQVHTWQVAGLAAQETIPFQPSFLEQVPALFTAPDDFEYEGYKGNMNSWTSFGNWINQLNTGKDKLPEATVAHLKALVADAPDDLTKVQKIYEYLQSKTRYVSIQLGIGGYQPFEASFVDNKGYGDCKALSNYTHAMLKAVGINSFYTLIRAGRNERDIQVDFPSNQFNHAVLCVPMAKDTIWLECTSQSESWGYSGSFTGKRHALLITPEGGKLIKTPVYNAPQNLQNRQATVNLDASGNGLANIETTYTALQQDEISHIITADSDTQKKWLYGNVKIPSFEIRKYDFSRQKGKLPAVTEKLNITINKYGSISGKRLFLTPNLLNQLSYVPPKVENRRLDVITGMPYIDTDVISYQLPSSTFEPELIPEPQVINSRFGEYSASVKIEKDVLTYTRTLRINNGRFPASAYNELIEFYKKIQKADKMQVVLATK
ncbi:DUF3857 domain-containing protein [Adhaeribacter rhizoryzae]|uniref:DUF3857 domain-containing protein n=1 Tax=Adhaeribacter rhizoryzae TaxID=2607907 RepID=A0A5M6DKI6_9BACT|nr:DUF3857 domain-containing protein [Adhaeribacter rhizoryzae]KAA5546739.1 DUF3857 domain-containing protein [Adhaeribacter rhizoryzae]